MNCREFQDHLDGWFDRPIPPVIAAGGASSAGAPAFPHDPVASAHLSECSSCREAWEELQLLSEAVPVWRNAQPQVDLKNRVVAAWRDLPTVMVEPLVVSRSSQSGLSRTRWQRAAAAALLVIGLGAGFSLMWSKSRNDVDPNRVVAVKSNSQDARHTSVYVGTSTSADSVRNASVDPTHVLSTGAMFRETAAALTGAADTLIPLNRAIVSAPPRRPGDDSPTKGSEIVKRDEEIAPFSQQLRDTLEDLVLPADAVDTPPT